MSVTLSLFEKKKNVVPSAHKLTECQVDCIIFLFIFFSNNFFICEKYCNSI